MVYVRCRTNLDVTGEKWPEELPEVPRMGDHIESQTLHGKTRLCLEVKRVTWKVEDEYYNRGRGSWYPSVELGLPALPWLTMGHFDLWYRHICGSIPDEYYRERMEVLDREYYKHKRSSV